MNAESSISSIHQFDGEDFDSWKFRMEVYLDEKDLAEYLVKDKSEIFVEVCRKRIMDSKSMDELQDILKKEEKKCKSILVQRVANSHLEYIKDKTSPKEIMATLSAIFQRKSVTSRMFLRKQLIQLKYNEEDEIQQHFLEFDKIVRQLKSMGANVEEEDIICHLLLSLPKSFETVVVAIETVESSKLSLDFVKTRLLDECNKRKNSDNFNNTNDNNLFLGKKSNNKFPKCKHCSKQNHLESDCWFNKNKRSSKYKLNKHGKAHAINRNESESDDTYDSGNSFIVLSHKYNDCLSASHDDSEIIFCVDSGCTDHLVNSERYMCNVKILKEPIKIAVAKSNEYIKATKIGDLKIIAPIGRKKYEKGTINNVLYVPNLKCNLFSVRRLEDKKMKTIFEKGEVKIYNSKGDIAARGKRENNLYVLRLKTRSLCSAKTTVSKLNNNKNLEQWHLRYGHLNYKYLVKLWKDDLVKGLPELSIGSLKPKVCEGCLKGKQGKLPYNKHHEARSKRPLELIHSDVWGKVRPNSYDGKVYFVSFIDDFTHFTKVYLMSHKSEVLKYFKIFCESATCHFRQKVEKLKCDNAKEYTSNEFNSYCNDSGISIEYTCPYSSTQNSIAERFNRTILEKARSMLYGINTPIYLWGEAILTATYILNRCPTAALNNNVPAELWYGKKPDISRLRIFGCKAFVHVPKERRSKLDSKSIKTIMIGYTSSGYKLWDPERRKITRSRDVIFDESSVLENNNNRIVYESDSESEVQENTISDRKIEKVNERKSDTENNDETNIDNETDKTDKQLRKSDRVKRSPDWYQSSFTDCLSYALSAECYVEDLPKTLTDLDSRDDKDLWKKAVDNELNSLIENNTWVLTDLPPGRKTISSRWVFRVKRDVDGNITKYKARLVAKGFSQKEGFDYHETYSPVVKLETVRILLAYANQYDLEIHQMDFQTAFLNGHLEETVYMNVPDGLKVGKSEKGKVCKLVRSLYGLKQAPRAWNIRFNSYVVDVLKFKRTECDYCLYKKYFGSSIFIILVFVDDLLLICESMDLINKIKQSFSKDFKMSDMGEVTSFLGFKIDRKKDLGLIKISQTQYIKKLLEKFGMSSCCPKSVPIEEKIDKYLCKTEDSPNAINKPYRELVGCLMYLMLTSRPDLSYAINLFSRFQSCPKEVHWTHLKNVLKYLKKTSEAELVFKRNGAAQPLECFADSDWASDEGDRRSTSGYICKVFGCTVSWSTRKQTTVALSSTEAEYVALASAICECLWIQKVLRELNVSHVIPTTIYEDNAAAIAIANNPKDHRRMKHLDVKFKFIREVVQDEKIKLMYISTIDQPADTLTKALASVKYLKHREVLGVVVPRVEKGCHDDNHVTI